MKRTFFAILISMLLATTGCSSTLSQGEEASDNAHAFLIQSSAVYDKIGNDTAPEGEAYLVIKFQIENLLSRDDSQRQWSDQIALERSNELYNPIFIESMDNMPWETTLLKHEKKVGYITFLVPDDSFDYRLTFTFPTSGTEAVYDLNIVDKRISTNVDWVTSRLRQIANSEKIPLIGGPISKAHPIMYRGIILVPKEEISQLIEQTEGLSEDAQKALIEDYLTARGYDRFE
jgi:hypothetical protein